jgi:hypothetical protein
MNVILYRKWYLSENWGSNRFTKIKHTVVETQQLDVWKHNRVTQVGDHPRNNHPLVLSGKAYWANDRELCVGYRLQSSPTVFRPIFSHRRQQSLDRVNGDIIHPTKFWWAVRMRYWMTICHIQKLPLDCADCIVRFIY